MCLDMKITRKNPDLTDVRDADERRDAGCCGRGARCWWTKMLVDGVLGAKERGV